MAKKFDLGMFMQGLNVSNSDTEPMHIEYIDIDLIDTNEQSFYDLSLLKPLAAAIAMGGLQQPLVVKTQPGSDHVKLFSGHRRLAALHMLVDDPEEPRKDLRAVPCVRREYESAAMAELQLIFANSTTRVLSGAETMRQAERIERLLYELKKEGYHFPGRMRDQVAAACKVSASKLARLKVIREKLRQPFLSQFEADKLSEQAAYALARMPENMQDMAAAVIKDKLPSGEAAEALLENYEKLTAPMDCAHGLIGEKCNNAAGRVKATVCRNYSWQRCDGGCCMTCYNAESCPGVCKHKREARKADKAEAAKEKAKAEKRTAELREEYKRHSRINAGRLLRAAEAAGLTDGDEIKVEDFDYMPAVTVAELRSAADGDFGDKVLYGDKYAPGGRVRLIELSQCLGCSTDYLLGLTDELRPGTRSWSTGMPEHDCDVVGKFRVDDTVIRSLAFFDAQLRTFRFSRTGATLEAECVAWVELPEDGT